VSSKVSCRLSDPFGTARRLHFRSSPCPSCSDTLRSKAWLEVKAQRQLQIARDSRFAGDHAELAGRGIQIRSAQVWMIDEVVGLGAKLESTALVDGELLHHAKVPSLGAWLIYGVACDWARAYYDKKRAEGKGHHAAVRALAFKWIRIFFRCWRDRVPYDEQRYLASVRARLPKNAPTPPATTKPTLVLKTCGDFKKIVEVSY
jgi:hypothetical protein